MTTGQLTRTILVVEDDASIAELITWALDDAGFEVRTAITVAEALRVCEQSLPDLIVADLLLPDGLGSELVCRIRERTGHHAVATLLMSAHPRAQEHASSAGADACLQKPFDLDEFFRKVEDLLGPGPALP